jgi:hypothetical protein
VKRKLGIRHKVGVPTPLTGARRNEHAPVNAMRPNLDTPGLTRLASGGSDVHRHINAKCVLDPWIEFLHNNTSQQI